MTGGNDEGNDEQSKKPYSRLANVIAYVIVLGGLAAVVGTVVYVWVDAIDNSKSVVERGCTPTAFNQFGIVTAWRCPAGVTL